MSEPYFPPVPRSSNPDSSPPISLHPDSLAAASVKPEDGPPSGAPFAPNPRTNLLLFLATVLSVFFVGSGYAAGHFKIDSFSQAIFAAWIYAVPLMAILLAHEFGHYIAARLHKVPASLPYFLPLPFLNPFGTLGAVIVMPERIRSRNALMDIGAAGPIAGMVVAIPLMAIGIKLSPLTPALDSGLVIYEGDSLLYWLLKRLVLGPIPEGYDIQTHPLALAAWVGFFVTFINLFPISQLDGGHIAYALFGERQNRWVKWLRFSPLLLVVYNLIAQGIPAISRYLSGPRDMNMLLPLGTSVNWLVLFLLLWFTTRKTGAGHPPTDEGELSTGRKLIGALCIVLFILVLIPSPWMQYWFS